jgi:signal transduction histidine kinase
MGLCHEVGNLLAATRIAAHLVAKGLLTGPAVVSTAAEIEAETALAGAFLGQVRPLVAEAALRLSRVTVSEIFGALERNLGPTAGGPVQLTIRTPRSLPDVTVDPDALHHTLVALVLSAGAATPLEGGICVSARRRGERVVLRIEDDGRPLEPRPPAGEAPRHGRRLVLAVADAVVRRLGGRFSVALRSGRPGTRVELALGAARPYAASRSVRREAGSRTEAGGSRRSQTRPTASRARSR